MLADVDSAADGAAYSRPGMVAHKNYSAAAATRLARSDEPHDRRVAAAHPGCRPTRSRASWPTTTAPYDVEPRPALPFQPAVPLIVLLGAADRAVAAGAAANRILPVVTMHQMLDQVGR